MADQFYPIPENPVYDPNIRKIQNGDYVDAEQVLGPVLQRMIENQAADHESKVDKETGKGLSSEDFTAAEKARLSGLGDGRRTCRFVVGTSTAGWTAKDCDYLCDGVDDQEEINAAIQALPEGGGEIVILDGIYNITASILMDKSNTILSGQGFSTVLKRKWDTPEQTTTGVIGKTKGHIVSGLAVKNMQIQGDRSAFPSINNCSVFFPETRNSVCSDIFSNGESIGIYFYSSQESEICGCQLKNNLLGIELTESSYINVYGCLIKDAQRYGAFVAGSGKFIVFCGNAIQSNSTGLSLYGENFCVIANSLRHGGISGGLEMSVISGNTLRNTGGGIRLWSDAYRNTITGNTIADKESANPGSTITLENGTHDNLVADNLIFGKNYVNSGTNNTFINNKYN